MAGVNDEETDPQGRRYYKPADAKLANVTVVVHPTALLSIADHYTRSAAHGTQRRVVGCLLGEYDVGGDIRITNTFGVPFEEDLKDSSIWYLDLSYLEKMYLMFRKINAKEQIMGWYSTASSIRESDIKIHEVMRRHCHSPIYLIVDVHSKDETRLPVQTYFCFEQPSSDPQFRRSFVHVPSRIGATEAEEVGVEHLLKDVQHNNPQDSSLACLGQQLNTKVRSLKFFSETLAELAGYLDSVADNKNLNEMSTANMLTQIQRLVNSIPARATVSRGSDAATGRIEGAELQDAFQLAANDSLLASYLGFATRLVASVHSLVQNKVKQRQDKQL